MRRLDIDMFISIILNHYLLEFFSARSYLSIRSEFYCLIDWLIDLYFLNENFKQNSTNPDLTSLIKHQSCHHLETSQLTCSANQLTGFYTMTTLEYNELRKNGCFRRQFCIIKLRNYLLINLSKIYLQVIYHQVYHQVIYSSSFLKHRFFV